MEELLSKKIISVPLFLMFSFFYLYLGYHLRDYIIDFSTFKYIKHPGVVKSDYVSLSDVVFKFNYQSRWLTNLIVTILMVLLSSVNVYIIFKNNKMFWVSITIYFGLFFLCFIFILFFSLINNIWVGYEYARFIKDNLIHTPFVFILLIVSFRFFKI